jgi:hypothetical protein
MKTKNADGRKFSCARLAVDPLSRMYYVPDGVTVDPVGVDREAGVVTGFIGLEQDIDGKEMKAGKYLFWIEDLPELSK